MAAKGLKDLTRAHAHIPLTIFIANANEGYSDVDVHTIKWKYGHIFKNMKTKHVSCLIFNINLHLVTSIYILYN